MQCTESDFSDLSRKIYLDLQKILRSLNLGRTMKGNTPSISVSQMRILSLFNEKEVLHISEISRSLGLTIQNVNNIIHRLEEADYVTRAQNKLNKRFSDIRLTANGRKKFSAFRTHQLKTLSVYLQRLDAGERKRLYHSLQESVEILEKAACVLQKKM